MNNDRQIDAAALANIEEVKAATNPLFNDNKLKLGMFGLNAGWHIYTKAPERYEADWDRCDAVTAAVQDLGLETMLWLAGWGSKREMETFTWAAGLAGRYSRPSFVSTMHVQLNHPVFVAKAAATIDRISAGRFGINIVAGATPSTFATFGMPIEDHETRYAHAEEFMQLLRRLWVAEESFDYEGRFYKLANACSLPKGKQSFPAIINAGTSERGRQFACEYADIIFTHIHVDLEQAAAQIADYKSYAWTHFKRRVQVWTHGYTVIRDTHQEAEDFLQYYASQHADHEAVRELVKALGSSAQSSSEADRWKYERSWAAGGGINLVGTAEEVADKLSKLSAVGLDGVLFATIEPETLLEHVGSGLLPLLEQAGLRAPVKRSS